MLAAVDAPKSKSITIAYLSLKSIILGYILLSTLPEQGQQCQISQSQLYPVFMLFYKLGFVLDLVSLIYFYLTDQFGRLEFYVFYVLHACTAAALIVCMFVYNDADFQRSCSIFKYVKIVILFKNILFFTITLWVMNAHLYTVLRFVHFGANLFWTFLWILPSEHYYIGIDLISIYHLIATVIGICTIAFVSFIGKNGYSSNCWRLILIMNIFGLIFCYIVGIFWGLSAKHGFQDLFLACYKKFGLVQLISPIFYLIFVNLQWGDPRANIVNLHQKIFYKQIQNQNFDNQPIF